MTDSATDETPYVLFVDDDSANLTVWEMTCRNDFRVLTAENAEDALALFETHDIGVVLADQRMPGTTGVELLATIREQYPDTERMLITAYSDLEAAVQAINRGQVARYLRKPWRQHELKAVIGEGLEIFRMRRHIRHLERRLTATERVYALGVVASSIAHELRNPVGWLYNNIELSQNLAATIKQHLPATSRPAHDALGELDGALDDAQLGVRRILEVIEGLELPTRDRPEGDVDLSETVRLALKIIGRDLQKVAQLELDLHPVRRVRGSSTKLGQVVLNLLVNAKEALEGRRRSENDVDVRLAESGDHVVLEVADNGPGISDEARARIFDPFFTTKDSTGLGLAISRRIAEEAGGQLEVVDREKGGAAFRLSLPVAGPGG